MAQRDQNQKKEKGKVIALMVDESCEENTSCLEIDSDEIIMLSKKLGNMLLKKKHRYEKSKVYTLFIKKFNASKGAICYNCKKLDHIKSEYLELVEEDKNVENKKSSKNKKYQNKNKKACWIKRI